MVKLPTSMRLTWEARRLLRELAEEVGVSQAAAMELAIRHLAKNEAIK